MGAFGDIGRDGDDEAVDGAEPQDTGNGAEHERLALDDDDEKLPWLESSDDDEGEGVDTGRIVGFALIGIVALLAILGGIWWATSRGSNADLVADGSTIEAPDAPYKTKPQDPGGKTFAGTGDTSFKVGEGQTKEGTLATPKEPKPAPVAAAADDGKAAAQPAGDADTGGVGVQVGAYASRQKAEAGWSTLISHHEALRGVKHRIVEGKADIGTVYRLQAVTADYASASALCEKLKASGAACQVKH